MSHFELVATFLLPTSIKEKYLEKLIQNVYRKWGHLPRMKPSCGIFSNKLIEAG